MNRRSFLTSLFGGLAVVGIGGGAMAKSLAEPASAPVGPATGEIDAATRAGLDEADAGFSQYHRRPPRHRPPPPLRHHRRPPPPLRHHHRPRRVIRNGRVYWIR